MKNKIIAAIKEEIEFHNKHKGVASADYEAGFLKGLENTLSLVQEMPEDEV